MAPNRLKVNDPHLKLFTLLSCALQLQNFVSGHSGSSQQIWVRLPFSRGFLLDILSRVISAKNRTRARQPLRSTEIRRLPIWRILYSCEDFHIALVCCLQGRKTDPSVARADYLLTGNKQRLSRCLLSLCCLWATCHSKLTDNRIIGNIIVFLQEISLDWWMNALSSSSLSRKRPLLASVGNSFQFFSLNDSQEE